MTRVLFDYDSIKYAVGFAVEERHIICSHVNNGGQLRFANRTEFYGANRKGGWLAEFNAERDSPHSIEEYTIEDVQTLKQFTSVKAILDAKVKGIVKHLQGKEYYGYIGKGEVFRHKVATIMQYKGNRNNLKPLAINMIEELLFEHHNAKLATDNLESDDWLSIDSFTAFKEWNKTKSQKDRLIVVASDKDHLQVEGHLFNPDKMILPMTIKGLGKLEWKESTSKPTLTGYGRMWLYSQIILGDQADCYKPSALTKARFGDVACYKLLAGCKTDVEALTAVVEQYKAWYPSPVTYTSWDGKEMTKDWLGIAEEMWQLAYMKRWVGDDTMFSKVIDKLGVKYE